MIKTEQIIARLKELQSDKAKLKAFNKENETDVESFEFIGDECGEGYLINISTKNFIFDIELFDVDYDDCCSYYLRLKETVWASDFDILLNDDEEGEIIGNMFELEGDTIDAKDIDEALQIMLPSKSECDELTTRIKRMLKLKAKIEEIAEENEGDEYIIWRMVDAMCN